MRGPSGERFMTKKCKCKLAKILGICLSMVIPINAQEHEEKMSVHLSKAEIEEFGIRLSRADAGVIGRPIELTGEIVVNPDRFAHVVPRVDGVVRRVITGLGDRVKAGAVMATVDSRELADLKSAYLAAIERSELAEISFAREEGLWKQGISSERDFLQAKQVRAEAAIEARSARHKLQAIGFTSAHLRALPEEEDALFARFKIRAPFAGVVVAKHITLGESVDGDTEIYSVTDLSQVWAVLTVYQRELKWIREGLLVTIRDRESGVDESAQGSISYVSAILDEKTRTASVRVVIDNPNGTWRPGMFVRGTVSIEGTKVPLVLAQSAVQRMGDIDVVFVYDGAVFHPREVQTGIMSGDLVEIVAGLQVGETVASQGAFTLRTQIEKREFESGHGH
jgi:cobalt-zinc-cadmium efflux system membrane fusion protein